MSGYVWGVCGFMQVCGWVYESVRRCAQVCTGVRRRALVCVKVFRGIWVCLSMDLETRILISADFNPCPIRIFRLLFALYPPIILA